MEEVDKGNKGGQVISFTFSPLITFCVPFVQLLRL